MSRELIYARNASLQPQSPVSTEFADIFTDVSDETTVSWCEMIDGCLGDDLTQVDSSLRDTKHTNATTGRRGRKAGRHVVSRSQVETISQAVAAASAASSVALINGVLAYKCPTQ